MSFALSNDELKELVALLGQAPFNRQLQLVGFDELDPLELLELLVLAGQDLDSDNFDANADQLTAEEKLAKIVTLLNVCGYNPTRLSQVEERLVAADKETLHHVLHWVASNRAQLQQRTYLSRFLVPVEVPKQMVDADPNLREAADACRGAQAKFRTAHAMLEELRKTGAQHSELASEVPQLENEKEQLQRKVEENMGSVQQDARFQGLFKVTSELRKEQEREARLEERSAELQQQVQNAEEYLRQQRELVSEMRRALEEAQGSNPLALAEYERTKCRDLVKQCKEELERKRRRIAELQEYVEGEELSEHDLMRLEEEANRSRDELQAAQARLAASARSGDSLSVYRQQGDTAMKRLKAAEEEEESWRQRAADAEQQAKEVQTAFEEEQNNSAARRYGGAGNLTLEQYKTYLRDLFKSFQTKSKVMSALRREVSVLSTTEKKLQDLDPSFSEGLYEKEENLDQAAKAKHEVDLQKDGTLDEISTMVARINAELRAKSDELRPMVTTMKSKKEEVEKLAAVHAQKLAIYNQTKFGLDERRREIETSIEEYERQINEYRRDREVAAIQLELLEHRRTLCERERNARGGEPSTLAALEQQIEKTDKSAKEYRAQHRQIKEKYGAKVSEKAEFEKVVRLLQAKCAATLGGPSSDLRGHEEHDHLVM